MDIFLALIIFSAGMIVGHFLTEICEFFALLAAIIIESAIMVILAIWRVIKWVTAIVSKVTICVIEAAESVIIWIAIKLGLYWK